MPGGFSITPGMCNGRAYGSVQTSFSSGGTSVQPSATAHTKGSWVQLTAATVGDTAEMWVMMAGQSGTTWFNQFVDIGIGAAGSEVVIAANLIYSVLGQFGHGGSLYKIACHIPDGTRIAARSQADTASVGTDMNVSVRCFSASWHASEAPGLDAIGISTATTRATAVAAGNSTKGSYSQLTAATTQDYCGIFVSSDSQGSTNYSSLNIDLAIGGAGSEVVIIPDVFIQLDTGINVWGPFMIDIPAGTRIAARASDLGGQTSTIGVCAYGIYL